MYLFVYGTLLSSIPSNMSAFLRRRAKLMGEANARGKLYDLGMYPGFQTGGTASVTGELYKLDDKRQEQTLQMLDAYEGVTGEAEDEYERRQIKCTLASGSTVNAIVYVSKALPEGTKTIKSGNYSNFYANSSAHQRFVKGGD